MRPIEILLVDDNPADVFLTQEAFGEARLANTLHTAKDGVQALEFLRREQEFADAPTPDVILLDLNMPRMSGLELLAILKEDPQLRQIPVIVLTTSRTEQDVWRSYDLHANAYIPKPVSAEEFFDVVRRFESFWFVIVALPPRTERE